MRTPRAYRYHIIYSLAIAGFAAACGNSSNPSAPTTPTAGTVTAVSVTSQSQTASSIQLKAIARMSDGSERDVTGVAAWQSSNASLATVSSTGLVSVFGRGELDIRSTYQNVSGTLHLLVANTPIVSMTITGAPSTPATSFQLTAMARLSDGSMLDVTRSATWESSNAAVAAVAGGMVTVVSDGEVDVRATYQTTTGAAHLTIVAPKGRTLTGFVTDAATNQPISGVRVQLIGGTSTHTDNNGSFGLSVQDGRVLVEFSRDGYELIEKDVMVKGDTQLLVTMNATK